MRANFRMRLILSDGAGVLQNISPRYITILAWGTLRLAGTSEMFKKKILTIYIHVIDRRFHHSFVNYGRISIGFTIRGAEGIRKGTRSRLRSAGGGAYPSGSWRQRTERIQQ